MANQILHLTSNQRIVALLSLLTEAACLPTKHLNVEIPKSLGMFWYLTKFQLFINIDIRI